MMSNGKNVIESKCFNKILAHYDGIIEFNNQKNWNSSPGNQWWVIALRFFLKAFSWQNLNPIKKNQKSKCIFIENYTYIYFSLLILCSCKLLKHLEQLDSKALLLNPIVSSLPSCISIWMVWGCYWDHQRRANQEIKIPGSLVYNVTSYWVHALLKIVTFLNDFWHFFHQFWTLFLAYLS